MSTLVESSDLERQKSENKDEAAGAAATIPRIDDEDSDDEDSDDELDDGLREMLAQFYEQIEKTEGFGEICRPNFDFFGGLYPIDFDEDPNSVPEMREITCFAIDDHNKKHDPKLIFSNLVRANYLSTAGNIFYITFEAVDSSSQEKKTYETRVACRFNHDWVVEVFRCVDGQR